MAEDSVKTPQTIVERSENVIHELTEKLTQPASTLETSTARRQARLLSTLLLSTTLFGLIAEIITIYLFRHTAYTGYYVTFTFLAIMAGLYCLSRTVHYRLAGWLSIGLITPNIFLAACDPKGFDPFFLYFLVLPLMLSSVFSVPATITLVVVDLVGMLTLPLLVYGPSILPQLTGPISFFLIMSSANHFLTRYHYQLERDRRRKLAQSEAQYRAVIEYQTELICRFDIDGTLTYVNEVYARYFGKSPEQLKGSSFLDLVIPEDRQAVREHLKDLIAKKKAVGTLAYRMAGAGGTVHWLQWIDRPIIDAKGKAREFQSVGRDVTEQMLIEQALAQERNLLRTLIDNLPDYVYFKNQHSEFILANEATAQLMGAETPEKMLGKTDFDFYPREFASRYYADEQHIFSSGHPLLNHEEEVRDQATQQTRWLLSSKIPLRDADGNISGLVGIGRDITAQKQTELALRESIAALNESEKTYRALFENANDAIFLLDLEGTHVNVNPKAAEMLGYTVEELIGMSAKETIVPDEYTDANTKLQALLAGEIFPLYERHFRKKDGAVLPVEINVSLVRNTEGQPKFIQSIVRDISARKRAEHELHIYREHLEELVEQRTTQLQESETRYRAVVEDQTEMICRFKADGTLTFVNVAYCRYFDKPCEKLVGNTLFDLAPEKEWAGMQAHLASFSLDQPVKAYEHQVIGPDGEIRWQQWTDRAIFDKTGTIVEYQSVGRDITERVKMEQALRESKEHLSRMNAELARAARLKDEFLASMSHELRTPLNSILGMAETLEEGIIGPINKRQALAVNTILSSGNHLLALINDVLDVSKIEAGKLTLETHRVPLETICQGSLNIIQETTRKKQQQIVTRFDPPVKMIEADPRRLKQILVNLLSNASKFTPKGGTIGLEVMGNVEKQRVQFVIWDTGIGIKSEDIPRLFTPFVQLDSSLARQHTGTGLGLSLVYRLTEMHGGSVSVESEPGEGTRFTVCLPWQPEAASQSMEASAQAPQQAVQVTNHASLLLVEDNPDNIKTVSKYLRAKGYTLNIAHTGNQALEQLQEEKPDLILMDIQMPEMDGLEAIRRIRAMPDYQTLPIIATTALAMPGDRERCLDAGANDYMSKPITLRELTVRVETLLKQASETGEKKR